MVSRLLAAIILVSLLALVGLEGGAMNMPEAAAGGSWTANIRVNDVPHTATSLSMAVDGAGNVYVLWMDRRDPAFGIYFSLRSAASGAWSTPLKVSDAPGQYAGTPTAIAVDGSGNAYAVWLDRRVSSPQDDLWFSRRDAFTGAWSPNVKLNRTNGSVVGGGRGWPALAVDSDGNAFALWADSREADRLGADPVVLFSARRDGATGEWGTDERFSKAGEVWGSEPVLAVDPSGSFYAIWLSATGYESGSGTLVNAARKFSRRERATGVWTPGTALAGGHSPANIVADARGNVHGVGGSLFSFRAAATGAWGTPVGFRDPVQGQAVGQRSGSLDAQGNDWVAWVDTRNEVTIGSGSGFVIVHGREIWAARRSAVAGVFGPNVRVDDHAVGSDRITPHIGADERGNVYAAWLDFRDNPGGIGMPSTGAGDIYFSMAPGIQAVLPLVAKGSAAGW